MRRMNKKRCSYGQNSAAKHPFLCNLSGPFQEPGGADPAKILELPRKVGLIAVAQLLGSLGTVQTALSPVLQQLQGVLEPGLAAQLLGTDAHLAGHHILKPPGRVQSLLLQLVHSHVAAAAADQLDGLLSKGAVASGAAFLLPLLKQPQKGLSGLLIGCRRPQLLQMTGREDQRDVDSVCRDLRGGNAADRGEGPR